MSPFAPRFAPSTLIRKRLFPIAIAVLAACLPTHGQIRVGTIISPQESTTLLTGVGNFSASPRDFVFTATEIDKAGWTVKYEEVLSNGTRINITSAILSEAGHTMEIPGAPESFGGPVVTFTHVSAPDDSVVEVRVDGRPANGGGGSQISVARTRVLSEIVVNDTRDIPDAFSDDELVDFDPDTEGEQTSLRAAISIANKLNSPRIVFDIPGGGTPKIALTNALPSIIGSMTIDGRTQPGSGRVCIDGSGLGAGADGFAVFTGQVFLHGLEVVRFSRLGIVLAGRSGHEVTACSIGTNQAGASGLGNGFGLVVQNVTGVTIGGAGPGEQNVISGNGNGVEIINCQEINLLHNYIGTAPNGSTPLPNTNRGLNVDGANEITIGSAADTSVISGSVLAGRIEQVNGLSITHTNFGVGLDGSTFPAGQQEGVFILNSQDVEIDDCTAGGFTAGPTIGLVGCNSVKIDRSRIGVNGDGSAALPSFFGIRAFNCQNVLIGTEFGPPNLISGDIGIYLETLRGSRNEVANCHIGVNEAGDASLNSTGVGVTAIDCPGIIIQGKPNLARNTEELKSLFSADLIGIDLSNCPAAVLKNARINADKLGTKAFSNDQSILFGVRATDSPLLKHEAVHVVQTRTGTQLNNCDDAEIEASITGILETLPDRNLRNGGTVQTAAPVDRGLEIIDSDDVTVASKNGDRPCIVAREGIRISQSSRTMIKDVIFRLEQIEAGALPDSELDVLIEDCEDASFIGLIGGYAVTQHLKALRSNRLIIQNCELGERESALTKPGNGLNFENCDTLEIKENTVSSLSGDAISLVQSRNASITKNIIGTDGSGGSFNIGESAIDLTGVTESIEVIDNILHNTDAAAISIGADTSQIIFRLNQSINVLENADRQVDLTVDGLEDVFDGIYGDGSTRISTPVVTGTPGKSIIYDVYAYPPSATGVEAHLYLGSETITFGPSGEASLNAVLDGSAPPDWPLTITATDPDLGTSEFSNPIMRVNLPDRDSDGLPDYYENQYPGTLDPDSKDDDEDPDLDGRTNLEEFIENTDPSKSDSGLRVEMSVENTGGFRFLADVKSGRYYQLQRSPEMKPGTWLDIEDVIFQTHSGIIEFADPTPPPGKSFYRVNATLPPPR